ncbi:nitroreductase family deazaflavin-dependent oxidoreductase [Desertihabitans brevis]|uniref:Nitroreductase family deazaflavin-dependent oxidoreductase n=1 Tax=Desertihabitans brevis TaxID=2268447 RepID=A0A367YSM1_9ACTN|nr:nitroreductase/quinone reductase family protein [Desertihabitans brevis]RCK68834.1 nitroreductase family deazaflavin-dependent oxidoreductase [Desertihabitans brevis]
MPSDVVLRAANVVHRALIELSGGRLGHRLIGMPSLELTTVGRRSGEPRSVMLTSPLQLGEALVVVASRGGDDRHPAWFLNAREHPDVQVSLAGGPRQPMRSRVVDAEERAVLWPQITRRYRNYAGYQRRTQREIPLLVLEPVPSEEPGEGAPAS